MKSPVDSEDAAAFLIGGLRLLGIDAKLSLDRSGGWSVSWGDGQKIALLDFRSNAPLVGERSGSSWHIHCHQEGCPEALELKRTTSVSSLEDDYEALLPALDTAAVFLGWRVYQSVFWCPTHTFAKKLVCEGCQIPCPGCVCIGGPRGVAAFGGLLELVNKL